MLPANTAAPIRVGVIGTGFIARDLFLVTRPMKDLEVTRMLTRRPLDACSNLPDDAPLTQSVSDLLDHCDVVVECSGDVIHATDVIAKAFEKPCSSTVRSRIPGKEAIETCSTSAS